MKIKFYVLTAIGSASLALGAASIAQRPVDDINGKRHPNLNEAQRLSTAAWDKISAAQVANEFDMDGHAQKAKDLLDQVNRELRLAATAANKNHR